MRDDVTIEARAAALRLEATRRWLVKDELVFLLLHSRVAGLPTPHAVRPRPPSGSLMVYDTREVPDYKKDGWRWQKRKDKSGRVREDRAKLVLNRAVVVLGSYVHSADTATFHRRSYYMRASNEHIVLVHYFDEVFKQQSPSGKKVVEIPLETLVPESRALLLGADTPAPGLSDELMDIAAKNFPPVMTSSTCSSSALTVGGGGDCDLDMLLTEDDGLADIASDFVDGVLYSDFSAASPSEAAPSDKRVQISDFSPEWDFVNGGAKILICLAYPLLDVHANDPSWNLFVQFGQARSLAEKLSDTVVRCTAPRSNTAGNVDLFILRCPNQGGINCGNGVLLTKKKRFVYRDRHEVSPTTSSMPPPPILSSLSINNGGCSKRGRSPNASEFLAERIKSGARGGPLSGGSGIGIANLSSYVESDLDERQCKIRVVERLSEFHQAIWTRTSSASTSSGGMADAMGSHSSTQPASGGGQGSFDVLMPTPGPYSSDHPNGDEVVGRGQAQLGADDITSQPTEVSPTNDESVALDDITIEKLSDQDLEQLSEQLLERVVRQLITLAHTSDELLEELNSLDETGLSLLHYVSFYNYAQLVPVLLAHGAHVNQQSTQGQTALHLAAGCGHEELVSVLLNSGADALMVDFDGLTAAERAEKSGHQQVATTLRRHMTSSASSLQSAGSPAEDGLLDLHMHECYPMEIDDDPVLYHDYQQTALWPSLSSSLSSSASTVTSASPVLQPTVRSHASSFESSTDTQATKAPTHFADENHEHNRKFLLGAFSTMSLHDKCALSLSISRDSSGNPRRRGSSISDEAVFVSGGAVPGELSSAASLGIASPALVSMSSAGVNAPSSSLPPMSLGETTDPVYDSDVKSVIAEDEESLTKLEAAIELMGPEERQSLDDEVKVLQHNIRAWLLRRNCRNMRETTKRLHEATRNMEDHQRAGDVEGDSALDVTMGEPSRGLWERERAAVTVQAATRSMLARRNFLQTRHVAIKVQAATRGVLCRKHFARMKAQAQASLVIQRNVREWWHKQPAGRTGGPGELESQEDEDKAPSRSRLGSA